MLHMLFVPLLLAAAAAVHARLQPRSSEVAPQTIWVVDDIYQGDSFFDQWDFFTDADPTHGMVTYVDRATAMGTGLALVQDGQAIMRVDNWTTLAPGENRASVRIQSQKTYNGGLFILDVKSSPYGCSVWPGYWTLGTAQQWPNAGEIDILEGVHNDEHDQVTWHTGPGCNLTTSSNYSGTAISTDCLGNEVGGCGIVDWSRASYGPNFDALGGGVYAMRWTPDAIDVWFFYRAAIPADIVSGAPEPSPDGWGLPSASLSSAGCDIPNQFAEHAIVFDMTICGDWAGGPSFQSDGCPGVSCAAVVQDPANFANASWVINSLSVYRQETLAGRISSGAAAARHRAAPLALALGLAALLALLAS